MDDPPGSGPLGHVTVVAIEQAVAAPLATRHLADLGARVIKVERPGTGDFARHYDRAVSGESSFFVWLNRGKQSLTLDLNAPVSRRVLDLLLGEADVLVHNLAPGAAERLGLGAATLVRTHPSLIIASVSGYGSDGPWSNRKAYDLLVQAETGLLSLTGTKDAIAKVPISIADIAAGMHLLAGILTALIARDRSGSAMPIEVSLFDCMADWMGAALHYTEGSGAQPERRGIHHATIVPYGSFATADGVDVLFATQNEREWIALCTLVLDRPDLVDDDRFASNWARVQNRDELEPIIAYVCRGLSARHLIDLLDAAGIAASRLNSVSHLARHPVLEDRRRRQEVQTAAGPVQVMRSPLDSGKAADWFGRLGDVPSLGRDTESLLKGWGYSKREIERLRNSGVI
jgi:itaconate CoA-transferase